MFLDNRTEYKIIPLRLNTKKKKKTLYTTICIGLKLNFKMP